MEHLNEKKGTVQSRAPYLRQVVETSERIVEISYKRSEPLNVKFPTFTGLPFGYSPRNRPKLQLKECPS